MLKPDELETEEGHDSWETLLAASQGDVDSLRRLIGRNAALSRAEFWYTPAIHFAVREGHIDAVRLLLDAGADPERNGLYDGSVIQMAKDRGHAAISDLLEAERDRRHRTIATSPGRPRSRGPSAGGTLRSRRSCGEPTGNARHKKNGRNGGLCSSFSHNVGRSRQIDGEAARQNC